MKSAERFTDRPEQPAAEAPRVADKRFSDPEWRQNPVFDFLHKAFLLGTDWANDLVDKADGLDPATKEKAKFYMRQISSALSPSNFVPTNPELLRETFKENGANLVRGMKMLAEDIAAGNGDLRIRHTDTSKFQVGVNMALTPGPYRKVVFRNDLMELLQYAPSTPDVLRRPLLIVPPWINKFYVLDLNPEKSFIRWAVAQGLTVFVISWVNPDERHAAKDFEAYMREGILAALDEVQAITGEPDVTAIGYCVGGTLLAVTLAWLAARGDHRISSATLFTAQVDFTHAGDLKVFADESQISETREPDEGPGLSARRADGAGLQHAAAGGPDLVLGRQQLSQGQGAPPVRPARLELGFGADAGRQSLVLSAQLLPGEQPRQGADGDRRRKVGPRDDHGADLQSGDP